MEVKIEGDYLIIKAPITRSVSKSGKSIVIASSNGNIPTSQTVDGKILTVGLNAYIKK